MDRSRLTFSTLGSPELDFNEILSLAKSNGFRSIELRGILSEVAIDKLTLLKPENRAQTKSALADSQVKIRVLGCSASFHSCSDSAREAALAECRYALELAKALEVPFIRVFGDRCPDEAAFSRVADRLRSVCELADSLDPDKNVTVLLEAHGDFNTAEKITRLFEAVNSDRLGLLWDVEHTFIAGEASSDFARKMLPYVKHVHLKDVRADNSLCLPGEGVIPLRTIADQLDSLGYTGLYSLEWEKRWHPELPDIYAALESFVGLLVGESK